LARYKHTYISERDSFLIYNVISSLQVSTYAITLATRSQAVARIADRTAKNSMGHVT